MAICPPGARISFDLDAVAALWEGRANLGVNLSKVTFLTNNEKRAILGFDAMPGENALPKNLPPPTADPPPPDNTDSVNGATLNGRSLQ
jgi:hypothetical protein